MLPSAISTLASCTTPVCHVCFKPLASGKATGKVAEEKRPGRGTDSIKASAHRRHVAYCQKVQNRPRVRRRACLSCGRAKVKCDFQVPCRRCRDKAGECLYDAPRVQGLASQTATTVRPVIDGSPAAGPSRGAGSFSGILGLDGSLDSGVPYLGSSGGQDGSAYLDSSDFAVGDLSFGRFSMSSDFLSENNGSAITRRGTEADALLPNDLQGAGSGFGSVFVDSLFGDVGRRNVPALTSAHMDSRYDLPRLEARLPLGVSLQYFPNCLTKLPTVDRTDKHSARLMVQVLRSYPLMMRRRETFPPFIHASCQPLPAPLANGMAIAQLFEARTAETRSFLWHSIQRESQHAVENAFQLSGEDLLAVAQVQIIYMIMRVADEAGDPPELNHELLWTFQFLCTQYLSCPDNQDVTASWKDWIHAESTKRIRLVFFIIGQIVCLYAGIRCNATDQFHDIPLCSAKAVWEARTEADWAAEHALARQHAHGLQNVGDLICAQNELDNAHLANALDSWNASADGLGHLLSIATSRVGCAKARPIGAS